MPKSCTEVSMNNVQLFRKGVANALFHIESVDQGSPLPVDASILGQLSRSNGAERPSATQMPARDTTIVSVGV
jgi:hypothetical protein